MPGTTQKKTERARPKKQTPKVKATPVKAPPKKQVFRPRNQPMKPNEPQVHVYVNNQSTAVISKTKTCSNRAPRRKAAPAPATSTPPPPPMFYSSTPAPIIVRPPDFVVPPQYEPTKAPAINVQTIEAPVIPPRTLEEPTNLPSMSIDSTPTEAVLPFHTKE